MSGECVKLLTIYPAFKRQILSECETFLKEYWIVQRRLTFLSWSFTLLMVKQCWQKCASASPWSLLEQAGDVYCLGKRTLSADGRMCGLSTCERSAGWQSKTGLLLHVYGSESQSVARTVDTNMSSQVIERDLINQWQKNVEFLL